ncbi:MAG: hypothetical protein AABY15_02245 [Nanoarchaeota archaeon]
MNNDNILVIHPKDVTTDVLSVIYNDINATVLRQPTSKKRLKELIKAADRVIMLGHGTEYGLGYLRNYELYNLIDSSLVYLLREKKDNIYIWCHADVFVKKYGLAGFSTGMFISEIAEAEYFNVKATGEEISKSNNDFSRIVSENVHKKGSDILKALKEGYHSADSKVVIYNRERLYNFTKP